MNKYLLFLILLFLSACTVYTEKQSEALSKVAYATKDSIDAARIDLADQYASEVTRLIKPPKKRIEIKSVFKNFVEASEKYSKPVDNQVNKSRIVVIPEKYKNDTVVVVSSTEYDNLLKDKETFIQLNKDYQEVINVKSIVDNELITQKNFNDKMISDLNIMQKKLVEKDLAILQKNIVIIILLSTIGAATYLRIKGFL